MPQSSPNAAATASDMDKNSGSNSSSASSGSSKGQQPPRSASAGPAGESKPKSGKGGRRWWWEVGWGATAPQAGADPCSGVCWVRHTLGQAPLSTMAPTFLPFSMAPITSH